MISKSHGTIISRYEVHAKTFILIKKNKNEEIINKYLANFKVKCFYLMHKSEKVFCLNIKGDSTSF